MKRGNLKKGKAKISSHPRLTETLSLEGGWKTRPEHGEKCPEQSWMEAKRQRHSSRRRWSD